MTEKTKVKPDDLNFVNKEWRDQIESLLERVTDVLERKDIDLLSVALFLEGSANQQLIKHAVGDFERNATAIIYAQLIYAMTRKRAAYMRSAVGQIRHSATDILLNTIAED